MSSTIRIVGFSGVVREESYNKAALRVAQDVTPRDAELDIVALDELPTYDAQTAADEPASVRAFKAQLRAADAVLIATPEYKGMLPHSLQNALSWIAHSDESALVAGKPVAVMGIGRQLDSERQHLILRQFLIHHGARVVGAPEVYVAAGWEKVDDEGNVADEATRQQIRSLMASLVAQIREQDTVLIK